MTYRASHIALGGVFAALAVAVMALGTIIPIGTFCCPAIAALLLIPVLDLCGSVLALAWYAAVAVLSLLLAPDREAAMIFLFLGYYPVLQPLLQRIRLLPLRVLAKLTVFNAAALVLYGLLAAVLGIPGVEGATRTLLLVTLALGNVTFVLFDLALTRLSRLYRLKWRSRLQKFGKH